ncbi:MAG: glycosyltransferase, partial [Actinobacteria bacterium]|nr:glycosyltransferase [Actinomycetota bacterium]
IVAVDTGSVDSSAKLVKGARIPVLPMDRDTGFGEAVAHAVATLPSSNDPEREWLWIIHDDLSLDRSALENLICEIESRPNVAMAGPKLLGWHDRTHLLEIGISIAANGNRWTGLEPSEYDQGQRDGVHEVLAVSTAGALIRRDVFEQLGGFDPNLDLFRDDVDFGWRVYSAGYAVISVSSAVGFHAEASANERRSVDVAEAFLHRPLLLDRRNAAYVLLVNSSWWRLPFLTVQLLAGSIIRSIGYLFAKLPGYAGDEILAVGALFIHPAELVTARKVRRSQRLVPSGIALRFIPSRWSQLRLAISRTSEWVRSQLFPAEVTEVRTPSILDENLDEEDLLTPASSRNWISLVKRPLIAASLFLFVLSLFWSRLRLGAVSGGALPEQPAGAGAIWNTYFSGWHSIAMGTTTAAPTWLAITAMGATLFFGKVSLLISLVFFLAPLFLALSAHHLMKYFSDNRWLTTSGAVLYAISPVSISAINSGRLSTLMILLLLPILLIAARNWFAIEKMSWRRVFALSLLVAILFAFSPFVFLLGLVLTGFSIYRDYIESSSGVNIVLFNARLYRRIALIVTPFLLCAPWSFELILHPHRLLMDSGFFIQGGGPNLALLGNPGGPGALPWYLLSPLTLVLGISLFSSTRARFIAEIGFISLLLSIIYSSVSITGNGTSVATRLYPGTLMAITTLTAIAAGITVLDKLRDRLISTHINIRHISAAILLAATAIYALSSTVWIVAKVGDAPLQSGREVVLPPFLAVEKDAKTMVIRPRTVGEDVTLNFYLARGGDAILGDPDMAPQNREQLTNAVREIADGSGLTASTTFAVHGIKYLFLKNPADENLVRIIDGLGGFTRASSTNAGIVWKIVGNTGRVLFTNSDGKTSVLPVSQFEFAVTVPEPGILTLTENYAQGWRAMQEGQRLDRKRSVDNLPSFEVTKSGPVSILYDGTIRRAWVSLQTIIFITVIVLALPAGRRRREIEDSELA